jgi:hypothetical protein
MLSELIYEGSGKIASQRVLDVEGGISRLETSNSGTGKFKTEEGAVDVTETWTYWSLQKPDGTLYGEGKGVLTTKDGTEVVTATGAGVGRNLTTGKPRYSGANIYSTNSEGKLAFLDNTIGVNEYEVDSSGNYVVRLWQWK